MGRSSACARMEGESGAGTDMSTRMVLCGSGFRVENRERKEVRLERTVK